MDSKEKQKSVNYSKVAFKWFGRTILLLLLLPLLLTALLQVPFVQRWTVDETTSYLSENMKADVKIKKFDISVFDGIKLGDFSIAELNGDTVIHAKYLNVSLSKNLFSLFDNTVEINDIYLENPIVNLVMESKSKKLNLARLIDNLIQPKNDGKKSTFKLNVKNVKLKDLDFKLENQVTNTRLLAKLDEGILNFNKLDLINNIFDIKTLNIIRPVIDNITLGASQQETKDEKQDENIAAKSSSNQLCLSILDFKIKDGTYNIQQGLKYEANKPNYFNIKNVRFEDINLDVDHFNFGGVADISASINAVTLKTDSGFKLNKFEVPSLQINDENIDLSAFEIKTNHSTLKNKVLLQYNGIKSLNEFYDKVYLDVNLEDSEVALDEVAYFVPSFANSKIYVNNQNRKVNLSGIFKGRLNNIKGQSVNINVNNKLAFNGDFGLRNFKQGSDALLTLRVKQLNTNINFIKEVVPGFNPPQNFYTLGNIDFVGNFDGYLNDFVAYGKLNTDIGRADLDMKLDVKEGNEKAKYSGNISLANFDLKKWSGGNEDLGKVSLQAKIKDGESLLLRTAKADMVATVDLFEFKGYDYKNVKLNGNISPKEFLGKLVSQDPNIDFDFDGSVLFNEKIPKFNFKSKIKNIDLSKLNLAKNFSSIKGDIVFEGEGNDINNLIGKLTGKDLVIVKNDTTYKFAQVDLTSKVIDKFGNKQLKFDSEKTDIYLEGKYNFNNILDDVKALVKSNFPYHTRMWNPEIKPISDDQKFKFDIEIHDPVELLGLAGVHNVELKDFKGKGYIDSKNREISMVSSMPKFFIDGTKLFNIQVMLNNKSKVGDLLFHVDSTFTGGRKYNTVDVQMMMKGDDVEFSLNSKDLIDSIQNISIKGLVTPHPKGYTISIQNNDLRLFGKRWKINNESKVSIGDKYFDVENFIFTDGERTVDISDINNKGLLVKATKINIAAFNTFINYNKILFSGELNSTIKINDIYNSSPSISGSIFVPGLYLNNDNFGELAVDLAKAENKPLEVLLSLSNKENGQALKVNGLYDIEKKSLNADVKAKKLSLKWLEYILKSGISNVKGYVDLDGRVAGKMDNLIIDAKAVAYEGQVKINYLGETYNFNNQPFTVTHNYINLSGAQLKDSQGNVGIVSGGLSHKLFKDFYLDAGIVATNVIAINTTKFDNAIYYGLGKGDVTVDFSGSVDAPKMVINCVTKPGTNISIPIRESRSSSDKSFITFIDKKNYYNPVDSTVKTKGVKVDGISIEMNLTMTEDAIVNMIFDEDKGDVIRGVGNGNMKISMSNKGEFDMFGTYSITRGQYLFTAFNFVNKPFIVREGGSIKWTGDPVNASINIEADYEVRTSLTNFLTEYLVTDQLKQAAGVSTPVNLKLILGNTLYNPSVKFDFEFPALTGELKSYTDSKKRLLKNNEAEYNSQVFGIIVFNTFIPSSQISNAVLGSNFIQSAGINTLSEFVGSQFSMYVTGLVNSALQDNGLISGIDFDLDLRNNTSFFAGTGTTNVWPTEIEIKLKNKFRFLDERLSVNVGGNYVRQNAITPLTNYVIPEFFIEYALTKDKQLNLKLYGKYDLDEINISNRRQKFGLGLRYKTDFGSMRQTKASLSDAFSKVLQGKS